MQLIKAYPIDVSIEGLVKRATVSIEVEHDECLDLSYMDASLRAKTELQLERGQLDVVWVKVTVRFSELDYFEGVDSLGQVFVSKPDDVTECVNDHGMVENAKAELVAQVLQGVQSINSFLGKAA